MDFFKTEEEMESAAKAEFIKEYGLVATEARPESISVPAKAGAGEVDYKEYSTEEYSLMDSFPAIERPEEYVNGHPSYWVDINFNHFGRYRICGIGWDGGYTPVAPPTFMVERDMRALEGGIERVMVALDDTPRVWVEVIPDGSQAVRGQEAESLLNGLSISEAINLAKWARGIAAHGACVPFIRGDGGFRRVPRKK